MIEEAAINQVKRRLLELAKIHNSHQKGVPLDTTIIMGYFRNSLNGRIPTNFDR